MSTSVADLVATLRLDATNFESGVDKGVTAVHKLGDEVQGGSERLAGLKDIAGIAATAIGGTFAGALLTTTDIMKNYTAQFQAYQTSFAAILGQSTQAADAHINSMENFAATYGIASGAVLAASKNLEVLTQGQHAGAASLKEMADAAAALQEPINGVAQAYGQAFDMLQRMAYSSGGSGGTLATRSLVNQGLISIQESNKILAEMKQGADPTELWNTLMEGAQRYNGAAQKAAQTNAGLISSFHDLLDKNIGNAFMPIVEGVDKLLAAANQLMSSSGFKTFMSQLGDEATNVGNAIGGLAAHIHSLQSDFSGLSLERIKEDIHSLGPEFGIIIGLLAEFGTEFVGSLPIINRFAGPFKAFLDDGRGALLGFMLASRDTRDALGNLGSAILDAFKGFAGVGDSLGHVLSAAAPIAATFINIVAEVVKFVAHNKEILDFAIAIVAIYEALKITSSVIGFVTDIPNMFLRAREGVAGFMGSITQSNTQMTEAKAAAAAETDGLTILTAAVEKLTTALSAQAAAQGLVNETAAASVGQVARATAATGLAAGQGVGTASRFADGGAGGLSPSLMISDPAAKAAQSDAIAGGFSEALAKWGTMAGGAAAIGGGVIAGVGAVSGHPNVTTAGSIISMAGTGAMIGGFLAPETGGLSVAAGAALGGIAGGITTLLGAQHASGPSSHDLAVQAGQSIADKALFDPARDLTNYTNIKARAQQSQSASRGLRDSISLVSDRMAADQDALDTPGIGLGAYMGYQNDMSKQQGLLKAAQTTANTAAPDLHKAIMEDTQATRMLTAAHLVTGKSLADLAAIAHENGLTLSGSLGSVTGKENITSLIKAAIGSAASQQSFGGKVYTPGDFQEISTQIQTIGNQSASTPGTSFSMGGGAFPAWLAAAGSVHGGNQSTDLPYAMQMLNNPTVRGILGNGSNMPTQETLSLMQQTISLDQQLASANHAVTDSAFSLKQAQEQLVLTQMQVNQDLTTHVNAEHAVAAAQQQHQDSTWNVIQSTQWLTGADKTYGDQLITEAAHVQVLQNRLDDLNRTYKTGTDALQQLTDKQKANQDITGRPLQGTLAQNAAIQANQMAQDQITTQIQRSQLAGTYSSDPVLTLLNFKLQQLQAQGTILQNQAAMTTGNQAFQVNQAQQQGTEVTFASAIKAAKAIGDLNPAMESLTHITDTQKTSLDHVNAEYDVANTKYGILKQAVDSLNTSDHTQITDQISLASGIHSVADASFAYSQSLVAVKLAAISAASSAESALVTITGAAGQAIQQQADDAMNALAKYTTMLNEMRQLQADTNQINKLPFAQRAGLNAQDLFLTAAAHNDPNSGAVQGGIANLGQSISSALGSANGGSGALTPASPLGGWAGGGSSNSSWGGGTSGNYGLGGDHTITQYIQAMLTKLGAPSSPGIINALVQWAQSESGGTGNRAGFNPFNSEQSYNGSTKFNSAGVQNYKSFDDGVNAWVANLKQSQWGPTLAGLLSGNLGSMEHASEAENSKWGAHPFPGMAMGGIVRGGAGGLLALVGEGNSNELVTPLPAGFDAARLSDNGGGQAIIIADGAIQIEIAINGNPDAATVAALKSEVKSAVNDSISALLVKLRQKV